MFGAALLFGTATAQNLDPRVAGPLMQMIQGAGLQCQAGNPQACGAVQQFQNMGSQLMQAQNACQQGHMQACQVFNAGAQQVLALYQQQMPQAPMAPAQGYSTNQMTQDHNQRMQQQRMQAQQFQNQQAQQRAINDAAHQRFMEQLRR
ncbi:hypothetical protein EJV46_10310 [Roseococcus sp. SYP-B2431]|nr:hypothetical protein EJV46_10310 [Roseococcus sp. SYP-B2431]